MENKEKKEKKANNVHEILIEIKGKDWEEKLNASSQFEFVQFHPGYSYADFVEGLKPQPVLCFSLFLYL